MLHVAQISFFLDPQGRAPERLLQESHALVDVAEAVARSGVRVSVIQAAGQFLNITRNSVDYHFLSPEPAGTPITRSRRFVKLLAALHANVLHVHGLGFPLEVLALARIAPRTPILLQDQANRPPRLWKRVLWRRAFSAVSGIAFCALAQSQPYVRLRLMDGNPALYEVPAAISRYTPGDREEARQATGLRGNPCLLWIARPDDDADPLTVLAGMREAISHVPQLTIWCSIDGLPLRSQIRQLVEADATMRARVYLVQDAPDTERLMRAADLVVLGGRRDVSSYVLLEALSCGLPPIVTDIPAFRALTADGAVGRLWRCGDAQALRHAIESAAAEPSQPLRDKVRAHFEREYSLSAVGRKLATAYAQLASRAPAA